VNILEALGYKVRYFCINSSERVIYTVTVLRRGFSYLHKNKGNTSIKDSIVREIIFDGVDSLTSTVLLLSMIVGFGLTAQLIIFLQNIGAETDVINILIRFVALDLIPFYTAIVLVCRNGSAMVVLTGNMSINQEIKSLELLGIDSLVYFAFPNLIGKMISQTALACYFSVLSISFGILFAAIFDSASNLKYFSVLINSIEPLELFNFLIKNMLFGMIVSSNATYHGLHVKYSVTEVPQRTQKAIMHSFFSIIVVSGLFIL